MSLDPKFVAKLTEIDEKYNPVTQQLQTLNDIAAMVQELVNVADDTKSNTDQLKALGAVLDDSRQQLIALNKKETPETPDYAKPVVDAVAKLSREVTTQLSKIDVKPQINLPAPQVKVDAPQVNVNPPSVDLKGIEKILKSDIPKAFEKAISQIPETPEVDQQPVLDMLTELRDWLKSIDDASRKKPLPGNMGIMANGAIVSTANPLPTDATFSGSVTTEPTFKDDPTASAEVPKYGKTNSSTHKQQVEADTSGNDIATQTTLALIKAKTDNLDVALSTRTKPADAQHVIVDSGVTTGLTDTQLRATPVPVSGTVTANAGTNLNTSALTLDTTTVTTNIEIGGLTETAPATDTASSGLNGRLQRIAQRLTSIIALLPGSLGQKARAASLAVTLSTEDITAITPPSAITNYAQESGGNLATLAGAITSSVAQTNLKQVNGVTTQTGTGTAGTGTQRVAVASDSSIILAAGVATIGALTANQSVNNAQVSGTATSVNSGTKDAGTQRVVIATDQPAFSVNAEIANDSGNPIPVNGTVTSVKKMATSGATSTVAGSASAVTLLASNASRVSADIVNDSTALLYIKKGSAASITDFTYLLNPATATASGGLAIIDDYSGILTGIWASATGNARITENT